MDLLNPPILQFLLTLHFSFNYELLFKFFMSSRVQANFSSITSFVYWLLVEIRKLDLNEYLHLSNEGAQPYNLLSMTNYDWTTINMNLRNTPLNQYQPLILSLNHNTCTIHHVLQTTIPPKDINRVYNTSLLYVVTYFIMSNTTFDES